MSYKDKPRNEYSVALVIRSETLSVRKISEILGMQPTDSYDKGPRKLLSRMINEEKAFWCIELECKRSTPLDKQVGKLLKLLRKIEEQVILLASMKCEIAVYCGAFPTLATQTTSLSPHQMAIISRLGASFHLVTYCYLKKGIMKPKPTR